METSLSKRIVILLCAFVLSFGAYFAIEAVAQNEAYAATPKYKIEVNTKKCVVTIYKKKAGKWKAFRAMLCSPGAVGTSSPHGTYKVGSKYRWLKMKGDVYAQYCSYIANNCLFHSVWYFEQSPKTQSTDQYNNLGIRCSHGCVRLATVDAKWIYDNCKTGTKIHLSDNAPTPLGKPKFHKVSGRSYSSWDPTDPNTDNKYIRLKKIEIKQGKSGSVQLGKTKTLTTKVYSKAKGFATGSITTYKHVKFYSNKKSVATVSSTGKIIAKKIGKATITAKIRRNGKTVKDKFVVKVYSKVKFNGNGGKLNGKQTLTKNLFDNTSSCIPTRDGYTFKGWYTAKSGGSKVVKVKKSSYTLYAHWKKDKSEEDTSGGQDSGDEQTLQA